MPGVALVTGGRGFVGRHLTELLERSEADVAAPSSSDLDLRDAEGTRQLVRELRPERVFHLAALASVGRSWDSPRETLVANQEMTVNLLEAVRQEAPEARVLFASSGEVIGRPEGLPVTEDAQLAPQSPYAVSKAACDLLGALYADAWGLQVVRTRAFNHAGPMQADTYVIGSITLQVAEAEAAGQDEILLRTGNPDAARDFTDVRDVVRAYVLAIDLPAGVYNVASERAMSVRDLIELLRPLTELQIRHEVDPARVRAHEIQEIRGSAAHLREATGWQPEIPLEQTVADALAHWRATLAG